LTARLYIYLDVEMTFLKEGTGTPEGRERHMLKIGIIVGSTRPGRKAAAVAKWVLDILKSRKDAEFEIVDIEDYKLPLLDEPVPPIMHQYSNPHTKTWSEKIASLDAYIFVTPEYNHATSAQDLFSYDVSGDGQRFLIITKVDEANAAPLSVLLNWASEMEK
jgi:NADPH-dependent FMN reductase